MAESNLGWGNQAIADDQAQRKDGVSGTGACIDWDTTERLLHKTRDQLKAVLPTRNTG